MSNETNEWSPTSWQKKKADQQPEYPDAGELDRVLAELSRLPPLVTSWEVETLRGHLAEAADGKSFLLQGGDCSERFEDCESDAIASKLKILLQMSLVMVHSSKRRVVRVGRFAGQYAKPRSSAVETRKGVTLPSYRGNNVNRTGFTKADRIPNPDLLLRGYERSALTLNFIRSLIDGGFADLHHPEFWGLGFVEHSSQSEEYQRMVEAIGDSIRFAEVISGTSLGTLNRVEFFTSHEGLHLLYEQAQTRRVPRREGWYNLGTHFPWIGDRTRALEGAHIEYYRGIVNPIGMKVGPSMQPDELTDLIAALDPDSTPGRLTLIHRFGATQIAQHLPNLIEAVKKKGQKVLWCCDPMHGNTTSTKSGLKTRSFDDILSELGQAFSIHKACDSALGGVHFELTGENVTECVGGARGLDEKGLEIAYKTEVDPRLNYEQSLEMAFEISNQMK